MITKILTFLFMSTTLILLWPDSCSRKKETNEDAIITLNADKRSGLVFFFRKGVSTNDQTKFLDEVLSVELSNNRGTVFLPGMESEFSINICGFDGYAINFMKNATEEQELEVIRRLKASPLVYKVYRNAIPNEITDICAKPNADVNEKDTIQLSPNKRSGLVFFFKKVVSTNQQTEFIDNVLAVKLDNNRGHWPLPGMHSTFGIRIRGFDGFAVNFMEDATEDQKLEVIRRLRESPLVYKIYRNAIPNEIDDL